MESTWEHPQLGRLTYDRGRDAWIATLDLPAFKAFTHTDDHDDLPGRCTLYLEARDATDAPSPTAISLALKVLANQTKLVTAITTAVWEDFNGRGPHSGMWWHGDIPQVLEGSGGWEEDGLPPLTSANALLAWMHPNGIIVRNAGTRASEKPIVELTFSATFEIEHSVGILTDGQAILGIGYVYDVEPFKTE